MTESQSIDPQINTILIVEDSVTQALKLQHLLDKQGYSVISAPNGREALKVLQQQQPDLIISDVMMPEMDGYDLCRAIKACPEWRGIPFILLTNLSEPEDIVHGLESGADNFVTKPYDEGRLLSRIQYILINREIRKGATSQMGLDIFFAGKKHFINSDRFQILDLLFSTYEDVLEQKHRLEKMNRELQEALDTIKTLQGLLPVCSLCKKIRDKKDHWHSMEAYITNHSEAKFSHSYCPQCAAKVMAEIEQMDDVRR